MAAIIILFLTSVVTAMKALFKFLKLKHWIDETEELQTVSSPAPGIYEGSQYFSDKRLLGAWWIPGRHAGCKHTVSVHMSTGKAQKGEKSYSPSQAWPWIAMKVAQRHDVTVNQLPHAHILPSPPRTWSPSFKQSAPLGVPSL